MKTANSNKQLLWAALGIVALVVIVALVYLAIRPASNTPANNTNSSASPAVQPANNSQKATSSVTITYTNDGFSPDSYMINSGGKVTVVNKSDNDLQFSSGPHPTHTAEPELNMGVLSAGQSGTFVVTKVGTWSFHNHLNEQDTGSLMVMK